MAIEEFKQVFKAVKNCSKASAEKENFWYEMSTIVLPKLDESHTKYYSHWWVAARSLIKIVNRNQE